MPSTTTELTNEQWALLNLLAKGSARAARARVRTAVSVAQLRELAADDMLGEYIEAADDHGVRIDLAGGNLTDALQAHVWLRLTDAGHRWVQGNKDNRTLRAIADRALTTGRCEIQAVAVPVDDDIFAWLAGRRLIYMLREDGAEITDRRPPSKQLNGQALVIKLTTAGENVIAP